MAHQPYFEDIKRALNNLHVMARLHRSRDPLRPLENLVIDGEGALYVGNALATPRSRLLADDEPLTLSDEQDPDRVVTQWITQRDHVILEDNQVDVYMGMRGKK